MRSGSTPNFARTPRASRIAFALRSTCTTRSPRTHCARSLSGDQMHTCATFTSFAAARAASARARGEAAPTVENGKAAAKALSAVAAEWAKAGTRARDVYVLQHLDSFVRAAVERVEHLDVGALEIVDGGDAESIGAVLGAFPQGVARVLLETGRAVGVDVSELIGFSNGFAKPTPASPSAGSVDREVR